MDEIFDFEELIFRIIRKWRFILSLGIILAVLAGGYRAYSGLRSMHAIPAETIEITEDDLELQRRIVLAEAYVEESILMKINPYDVNTCVITFWVQSQDETAERLRDREIAITALYASLQNAEDLYESIRMAIDTDIATDYLRELISVSDQGQGLFVVMVASSDIDLTEQIAGALADYYSTKQSEFSRRLGAHSLQIIDKSSYSHISLSIENHQNEVISRLDRLMNNAKKVASSAPSAPSKGAVVRSVVMYAAMGGAGGIGISVLLLLFLDSARMAVRSDKELRKKYGLRFLGSVSKG